MGVVRALHVFIHCCFIVFQKFSKIMITDSEIVSDGSESPIRSPLLSYCICAVHIGPQACLLYVNGPLWDAVDVMLTSVYYFIHVSKFVQSASTIGVLVAKYTPTRWIHCSFHTCTDLQNRNEKQLSGFQKVYLLRRLYRHRPKAHIPSFCLSSSTPYHTKSAKWSSLHVVTNAPQRQQNGTTKSYTSFSASAAISFRMRLGRHPNCFPISNAKCSYV